MLNIHQTRKQSIFKSLIFTFIFSLLITVNSCSDNSPEKYPQLILGHWYTKDVGNRIDLIFVDNKKVVVVVDAIGLSLDRKYKFIENNQFLMIEGFKNYHKIARLNDEEMSLVEDPHRKGKKKSPLVDNIFTKIKDDKK